MPRLNAVALCTLLFFALGADAQPAAVPDGTSGVDRPSTQPASADAMLERYAALRIPAINADRFTEPSYLQTHQRKSEGIEQERAQLAWDFYTAFPDHPKAGKMLSQRWLLLARTQPKRVLEETEQVLARQQPVPARAEALHVNAALNLMGLAGKGGQERATARVEQFIREFPDDSRAAMLLRGLAETAQDAAEKEAINQRLHRDYPDSAVVQSDKGQHRRGQAIGKPFELTFTDAISGKKTSTADMKGKVIIVDFWATWCGPCIAAIPELKRLYNTHHDKGLEVIGVSLDVSEEEGGLQAMKDFVEANQIPWPQYYQGNHWESEFSSSWGVNMVPTVFLIDRAGNLFSTDIAHGLEPLVQQLLDQPAP